MVERELLSSDIILVLLMLSKLEIGFVLADFIVESKNSIGKKNRGTAIVNFDANRSKSFSTQKRFGVMKFGLTTLGIEYKQKRGFGFEFINRNPNPENITGADSVSVRYSYDRVYAELYTSYKVE